MCVEVPSLAAKPEERRRNLPREPQLRAQQPVLERCRLAAADLFAQGRVRGGGRDPPRGFPAERPPLVCAWQTGGIQALRTSGPIGRHRKLSAVQLGRVEQALLQRAGAHGFTSNLWTLDRVTEVICG
jgi:hypothetical protein